jgi:hypothetical protein
VLLCRLGQDTLCPVILFVNNVHTNVQGRLCQEPVFSSSPSHKQLPTNPRTVSGQSPAMVCESCQRAPGNFLAVISQFFCSPLASCRRAPPAQAHRLLSLSHDL